ncbi:hypothetical protein [Ideonella paludis]|uniref:hypothetical protein n=1 Tax=Ideonella paludis TaxID=1233411 RepID=UPI003641E4EE
MSDTRTSHSHSAAPLGRSRLMLKQTVTRGQAALAFVAVSCVCVLGVLGIHHWRVTQQEANRDVATQAATLKWAKGAVDAFAAWHGRLPCPAAEMGAREAVDAAGNCTIANGKGWLPVATLMTGYAGGGSAGGGGGGGSGGGIPSGTPGSHEPNHSFNAAVRYVAYRNSHDNRDLVAKKYGWAGVRFSSFADDPIDGFDLCGKVGQVDITAWTMDTTAGADMRFAHSFKKPGSNQPAVNIAYGLAVSAAGEAFSDLNASNDPVIESPNRPRDGSYRDVTEVVPFDQLLSRLGCRGDWQALPPSKTSSPM